MSAALLSTPRVNERAAAARRTIYRRLMTFDFTLFNSARMPAKLARHRDRCSAWSSFARQQALTAALM